MIGIPASTAARALSEAPSVKRNPRRDGGAGGKESWFAHIGQDPPGRPGTGVRFVTSQATTFEISAGDSARPGNLPAPVGHPEVRASRDHGGTQMLIAHERRDTRDPRSSAPSAHRRHPRRGSWHRLQRRRHSRVRIAEGRRIWRDSCQLAAHRVATTMPEARARANRSARRSACRPRSGEGGLGRARHALRDDLAQTLRRDESQVVESFTGRAAPRRPSRPWHPAHCRS
jgi:hypothetical protein